MEKYIHGYSPEEQMRLVQQARDLKPYVFPFLTLGHYANIAELGMGVGAETLLMLEDFPNLRIRGFDYANLQIEKARILLAQHPSTKGRYTCTQADARDLKDFDFSDIEAVVIIWVLEHAPHPLSILSELKKRLPVGTPIYITEVANSSLRFTPELPEALSYWQKACDFQAAIGGNPDVGLHLKSLLLEAGFSIEKHQMTPIAAKSGEEPARFKAILTYWIELMHSQLASMLEAKAITEAEWQAARSAMLAYMNQHDAQFFYEFCQIKARS
jgi:hypothetical protein